MCAEAWWIHQQINHEPVIFCFDVIARNGRGHQFRDTLYACFLDARKACDRVSYSKLFSTLADRGVSPQYLKILLYWFRMQTMGAKS